MGQRDFPEDGRSLEWVVDQLRLERPSAKVSPRTIVSWQQKGLVPKAQRTAETGFAGGFTYRHWDIINRILDLREEGLGLMEIRKKLQKEGLLDIAVRSLGSSSFSSDRDNAPFSSRLPENVGHSMRSSMPEPEHLRMTSYPEEMVFTPSWHQRGVSRNGGLSKAQRRCLGLGWPPRDGDVEACYGCLYPTARLIEFKELRDGHLRSEPIGGWGRGRGRAMETFNFPGHITVTLPQNHADDFPESLLRDLMSLGRLFQRRDHRVDAPNDDATEEGWG
ncbi:MerR family transcriptional regulator [bacterium]|nr:MerR family transcriptional regulator [bacterium]